MGFWHQITQHSEGSQKCTVSGKLNDHYPWDALASQLLKISSVVNW